MKRFFLTVLITIAVFAAGVVAGMWIQRTQPVPPPPTTIMGEIRELPLGSRTATSASLAQQNVPKLKAEIEKLKPEVEEFKKKLEPIKQEFRDNLEALLSEEQRVRLQRLSEKHSSPPKPGETEKKSARSHRDVLDSLFPIVVVPNTLEKLRDELKLTESQQVAVHELLLKRRQKFLQLVDANPPPSLKLQHIAPLVPQVAKPDSK
jgi:hypothetical protein